MAKPKTTTSDLVKPSRANGGITPFKNDNAEKAVRTARGKVNDLKDQISNGTYVNASGVSTHKLLREAESALVKCLEKHNVTLTDKGFTLCKVGASRGFDKTLGLRDGYDVFLTEEQSIALNETESEYRAFCATEKGQEYQGRINDEHRKNGHYVSTKHRLKVRDGRTFFSTSFVMESAMGAGNVAKEIDSVSA